MKKELQELLYQNHHQIFVQKDKPMSLTCMCWGIDTKDGWYNIIDTLCSQIQWHMRQKADITQVEATQVKEKYGSLRFYYIGGDDYIRGLVDMAEAMSRKTCEHCGAPGKQRGAGWIITVCDPCNNKITSSHLNSHLDKALKSEDIKDFEEVIDLHKTHGGD